MDKEIFSAETLIIGGGPGGYVAAIKAAQLGQKVTLIEADKLGGICLNAGCIPSKSLLTAGYRYRNLLNEEMGITATSTTLDVAKAQQWKEQNIAYLREGIKKLVAKNKITLVEGYAYIEKKDTVKVTAADLSVTRYTFSNLILAMGGSARQPELPLDVTRVIKSTEILALPLTILPQEIAIISCDFIGAQVATAFRNIGVAVTLFISDFSIDLADDLKAKLQQQLVKRGVDVIITAEPTIVAETATGITLSYPTEQGEPRDKTVDYIIYSQGRVPNTKNCGIENSEVFVTQEGYIQVDAQGRTTQSNIYAIGDLVAGEALAQKASYEGKIAAEAIGGGSATTDYYAMPTVMYTNPEIARVGLTTKAAVAQGYKLTVVDYQRPSTAAESLIRIITRTSDDLIIGAELIGDEACEWCGPLTLAVEGGLQSKDLTLMLFMKQFYETNSDIL